MKNGDEEAEVTVLKIWGVETSRTLRAYWALEELGLSYESVPIQARTGETQGSEYTRINSKQKIPCLEDGSLVVSESAAIVQYLFKQYGNDRVYVPGTAAEQAKCDEWCFGVMTEIDAHALYIIRRHDELSHIYGEAPEAAASAREYFDRMIHALAKRLPQERACLLDERISAPDIMLTTCLDWATRYELQLPKNIAQYHARQTAREAYLRARAKNYGTKPAAVAGGA